MGIDSEVILSRVSQHSEVARAALNRLKKLLKADRQKKATRSPGNCVFGWGEVLDRCFVSFQWVLG